MNNLKTVTGSIEFREAVWDLAKTGQVYVRLHGHVEPTYFIVDADRDFFRHITVRDLFKSPYAPATVETIAKALIEEDKRDRHPKIDVFNL